MAEIVTRDERAAAYSSALYNFRAMIGADKGMVPPNARIGSLSDYEIGRLIEATVSGFIVCRSYQMVEGRYNESKLLATGEVPEPYELGTIEATLPDVGKLLDGLRLMDVPISAWSKLQLLTVLYCVTEFVIDARTSRDERPSDLSCELVAETGFTI